jgi:3-methyladenine DNA glycosylase Mpg
MSIKNYITNEKLCEKFDNPFVLVNHAIQLAKTLIGKGVDTESNPTNTVLESIIDHPESYVGEDDDDDEIEE